MRLKQVWDNLYVGDIQAATTCSNMDIVSLIQQSPQFTSRHLHINMVDAREPKYFNIEQFLSVSAWIRPLRPTLIHCNEGKSRGPSMALYYLALNGHINSTSYYKAYADFKALYPDFMPNTGIREFMSSMWGELMFPSHRML